MRKLILLALLLPLFCPAQSSKLVILSGDIDSASARKIDSIVKAIPSIQMGADIDIFVTPVTVQLNAKATGNSLKYLWEVVTYVGAKPVINNPAIINPEASGLGIGTYTFRLTVTDAANVKTSSLLKINVK